MARARAKLALALGLLGLLALALAGLTRLVIITVLSQGLWARGLGWLLHLERIFINAGIINE